MIINDRVKKIILAIVFVILIIALATAIYLLFFKPLIRGSGRSASSTLDGQGTLPGSGPGEGQIREDDGSTRLPQQKQPIAVSNEISPSAQGGLTETKKLNNDPVANAKLAKNGANINYYNKKDNKFYYLDRSGQAKPLSDKEFYDVESVTWSNQNNLAIIEYPDGANIVYDFSNKKQTTLPTHWDDFSFSKNDDTLSMKLMGIDPDNRYLAVSNYNGSRVRPVEPLGIYADTVTPTWSANDQVIGIYSKGLGFERQEIFFIGQNNENFKSIVVQGRGFEHIWSPNGDKMLYSTYTDDNKLRPTLWTVSSSGDNIGRDRRNLNLDTWAHKCVYYDETQIYCAVPEHLPEGAGFMPELGEGIPDNLYELDPLSGLKKLIAVPDGDYQMENLMVDKDGRYLYFVDQFTQNLHQIRLK
ncbi:MAG: hypothetical protein U9Q85_02320 [Patescibacteria group bacterium]|nr:hypothetical protein [Patescibacteria group bacterium]